MSPVSQHDQPEPIAWAAVARGIFVGRCAPHPNLRAPEPHSPPYTSTLPRPRPRLPYCYPTPWLLAGWPAACTQAPPRGAWPCPKSSTVVGQVTFPMPPPLPLTHCRCLATRLPLPGWPPPAGAIVVFDLRTRSEKWTQHLDLSTDTTAFKVWPAGQGVGWCLITGTGCLVTDVHSVTWLRGGVAARRRAVCTRRGAGLRKLHALRWCGGVCRTWVTTGAALRRAHRCFFTHGLLMGGWRAASLTVASKTFYEGATASLGSLARAGRRGGGVCVWKGGMSGRGPEELTEGRAGRQARSQGQASARLPPGRP